MNVGGNIDASVDLKPVKLEISISDKTLVMLGVIALMATVYGIKRVKR